MRIKTFKVSELNGYIAKTIASNPVLHNVSIEGEVCNLKKTNYGYIFFSLRDEQSKISCILNQELYEESLKDGAHILLQGKISFYSKNGSYSILVREFAFERTGEAYREYLRVKEELEQMGCFDLKHKKPLPLFPKRIGIVTSAFGAVIEDIVQIIKRRYPVVHLLVYDARVQGDQASYQIIEGLRYFNRIEDIDLIILARGGGSYDELSVFNNRELALEIFESKHPVVSAIGHESDYLISDMVADLRAPTPSAAAELCVPESKAILEKLNEMDQSLSRRIQSELNKLEARLESSFRALELQTPFQKLRMRKYIIQNRLEILHQKIQMKMNREKTRADFLYLQLDAVNPVHTLKRGYVIAERKGRRLCDIRQIKEGDEILFRFQNGALISEVKEIVDLEAKKNEE